MKYMVYDSQFSFTTGPFETKEKARDYINGSLKNTLKTHSFLIMEVVDEVFGLCDRFIED